MQDDNKQQYGNVDNSNIIYFIIHIDYLDLGDIFVAFDGEVKSKLTFGSAHEKWKINMFSASLNFVTVTVPSNLTGTPKTLTLPEAGNEPVVEIFEVKYFFVKCIHHFHTCS